MRKIILFLFLVSIVIAACNIEKTGDAKGGGPPSTRPGTTIPSTTVPPTSDCISNCTNRECGDDGCGGSCGNCSWNEYCLDGVCLCLIDCDDNCTINCTNDTG